MHVAGIQENYLIVSFTQTQSVVLNIVINIFLMIEMLAS